MARHGAARLGGAGHGEARVFYGGAVVANRMDAPFIASFSIEGVVPLLMHRWTREALAPGRTVEERDDLEQFVWRDETGAVGLPGLYLFAAMGGKSSAAGRVNKKYKALFQSGVAPLTVLAPLGKTWDAVDERRAVVQRNPVNRRRPMFREGWKARFEFLVTNDAISPDIFEAVLRKAGEIVGVGDYRPIYGRFRVTEIEFRKA